MQVRRNELHVTCHRDGRTTVTVGTRLFDAEKVVLKTNDGKTIAAKPSCNLFSLPSTLQLEAESNAELFPLATVAQKLKRTRKAVDAS